MLPEADLGVLVSEIRATLGEELVGLYLYGSYVTGGFDPGASDLDMVAVTSSEVEALDLAGLERMHDEFVSRRPEWNDRVDVTYVGQATLRSFRDGRGSLAVISPGEEFHVESGVDEWLLTWYQALDQGQALLGPDVAELVPPITRAEFVAAIARHAQGFRHRTGEDASPGARAYAILTMCRALRTVRTGDHCSKQEAAAWAKEELPEWAWLIDAALACRLSHGKIGFDDEETARATRTFIAQVADTIAACD